MALSPLWTRGVRREVLPNGLTLLVQPVPGSPAVAAVTRVRAGFFDEPDEWAGISHVLEHMFFKGTPSRGVGAIARETKAAGGYLNAATSYDYTAYYVVLPARGLREALTIQADALRHAALDPEELAREIVVIIEEARRKLDSPGAVAQETLHQLLYDHHRIRRWRIGTEEGLSRLRREDLERYYRTRYVPERTMVAIAGGVDPDQALAVARDLYGDWAAAPGAENLSPAEPPRRERHARTVEGDVRQTHLTLGWRGVGSLHPQAIPLELGAAVLSLGRSSRLYRALRETGVVSSVGAGHFSPTEVGVFSIGAELDATRLDPALRAIAAELIALCRNGPTAAELERVRTLLRARWARRFESAEGRASELAAAEALSHAGLLDEEYERMLRVPPDEIRRAVAAHLDPQAVAAVAYVPRGHAGALDVDRLAAAFDVRGPARTPPAPGLPLMAPPPRAIGGQTTAGVLHVELPGVDLLLWRRPAVPTASIAVFRARTRAEAAAEAGLGALAVRSAVRGAGPYDTAGLADAVEGLGGTLGSSVSADWFGFSTTVLVEHLARAAALLELVLRAPRFESEAILTERGLLAEDAARLADDMFRRPMQLAYAAAFGERGYGLPLHGHPETVGSLTPEAVRTWHQAMIGQGRVTVVAVGDFDPERAASDLAGSFAGYPAARAVSVGLEGQAEPSEAVTVRVEERDKAQTALAMLFPGPHRRAPDRHVAEVWSAWCGGLGGKLFEALRDRRSLAYTVAAYPWQRRQVGGLITYIATSPSREDEAREAMLAELRSHRECAPAPADLAAAVAYLTGQSEVARQSAAAMLGEIFDAWIQGTGLDELADPGAPFRAVRPEDVRRLAVDHLDPQGRVEGIVRGLKTTSEPS